MPKHHSPREEPLATRKQVFTCPHCGERISMVLDLSVGYQRHVSALLLPRPSEEAEENVRQLIADEAATCQ